MAEGSSSSNNGLYFIVGGLVVVVGIISFLYFGGVLGSGGSKKIEIQIETPKK